MYQILSLKPPFMKKFVWLYLLALPLLFWTCGDDDDPEPMASAPQITINPSIADGSNFCIGQIIDLAITVTSGDPLNTFTLTRNADDQLEEIGGLFLNTYNYTVQYQATAEDLQNGTLEFTVTANDAKGTESTSKVSYNVVAEFAFVVEMGDPNPGYDLVTNATVESNMGANIDIVESIETEGCGPGCVRRRITFTAMNGTVFYNLPFASPIQSFRQDFKLADVEAAIAALTAETTLVVYSDFSEDATAGPLNNFPIVANIRGSGEYAIIGRNSDNTIQYLKRSETAGQ